MTEDEAVALGRRILAMTTTEYATVRITHTIRSDTRIANNRVLISDDGEELAIRVTVVAGRRAREVVLDQRDDASLHAAIAQAETFVRQQAGALTDPEHVPIGPQKYLPATLWHDQTATTLDTERQAIVPELIEPVKRAGLDAYGFFGGVARTRTFLTNEGLQAVARETDAECTITARTKDGRGSGWAGMATRDVTRLNPTLLATHAADIAVRSVNPVAFEPGRRTAILSPAAVAQFIRFMGYAFEYYSAVDNGDSPFSRSRTYQGGSKRGARVFDPRLLLVSDPSDPDGGYPPFFVWHVDTGLPLQRITWVEGGVLKNLACDMDIALKTGHQAHMPPTSMRLAPMPGVATQTLDEMIAGCKEGIYVNRISNVDLLDRRTGIMSGVTRDGCFLIRNGKIEKPIKNFRFLESPFFFLNNVMAIGIPERTALGFVPDIFFDVGNDAPWPHPPIVVPPLMVRDFNFSSLSDAI